jgi:plasmid stabilization system protein ParE
MSKVIFTQTALNRIASIKSDHFNVQETILFQIELLESIHDRLSTIMPMAGYREYKRGPWANTRRILVCGYKIYYFYDKESDEITVKGIKAPGMK